MNAPALPQADTARRLVKLLVDHLGVAEADIGPDVLVAAPSEESSKPNLGADSLDIVELAMAAEDEFNIDILDEDVEPLNRATFGELVDFVHARVDSQS